MEYTRDRTLRSVIIKTALKDFLYCLLISCALLSVGCSGDDEDSSSGFTPSWTLSGSLEGVYVPQLRLYLNGREVIDHELTFELAAAPDPDSNDPEESIVFRLKGTWLRPLLDLYVSEDAYEIVIHDLLLRGEPYNLKLDTRTTVPVLIDGQEYPECIVYIKGTIIEPRLSRSPLPGPYKCDLEISLETSDGQECRIVITALD